MTTPRASAPLPIRTTLVDITNCIGCRACQVACKQWNEREGEETELCPQLGFQNPATLSAKTYTLISFHEMENPEKPGGLDAAYVMRRCLHCLEPGLRLGLSDDGAVPAARWAGVLRRLQVHRLPVLHARLSVGRADRGVGQARAEDREVHALRGPHHSAGPDRIQRVAGARRTRPSDSSTRSRPRPASRRAPRTPCATEPATRCSRSPTSAWTIARTSTSTTSTGRRSLAARACCTSRRCLSRSSGSRPSGRSRFRGSPRLRSGPCLPPS